MYWNVTLGARDFSIAVSGFCQVFTVTRAKSFGCDSIRCHFSIRMCLRLGTDGLYCVTMCILGNLKMVNQTFLDPPLIHSTSQTKCEGTRQWLNKTLQ